MLTRTPVKVLRARACYGAWFSIGGFPGGNSMHRTLCNLGGLKLVLVIEFVAEGRYSRPGRWNWRV